MSASLVEQADEVLVGVTPGEWTWTHGMDARATVLGPDNLVVKLEGYADANFIAKSRYLVPALRDEVVRLNTMEGALGALVYLLSKSDADPVSVITAILGNASEGTVDVSRAIDIAKRAVSEACDNREGK